MSSSYKVFIISGDSISTCADLSLKEVHLTHPTTKCDLMYLMHCDGKSFYEVVKQTHELRSWFIDDYVQEDGGILFVTQVDPLFIVLPFIAKNNSKFRSLYDLLSDDYHQKSLSREIINALIASIQSDQLELIADVKSISDETFIKFNREKTLEWLKSKVKNVSIALKKCNVSESARGSKVAGFTTGKEEEEEKSENHQLAYEIVKDYLDVELASSLSNSLGLDQEEVNLPSQAKQRKSNVKDNVKEVGMELAHSEVNSVGKMLSSEVKLCPSNRPAIKMTKSQRQLSKVDKSGMKNIQSFFKPKPK